MVPVLVVRIAAALCLSTSTRLGGSSFSLGRSFAPSRRFTRSSTLVVNMSTTPAGDDGDKSNRNGVGQADIGKQEQQYNKEDSEDEGKSWRQLLEVSSNRSRKIRGSNYVQLATTDPETNEPRVRCVVFRGFVKLPTDHPCYNQCDDLSCVMRMITDQRSQKVLQIMSPSSQNGGKAELLWWFPKTSEQYRIRGRLVFVGGKGTFEYDRDPTLQTVRKEQWGNLSDSARESFFHQQIPGAPYAVETAQDIPPAGRSKDGKVVPPPDNFLLMLLLPEHCDYLRLTNMYRQIDVLETGSSTVSAWMSHRVNP